MFGFLSQEKGLFAGHCFREGGVQPKFLGKLGFKIGADQKAPLILMVGTLGEVSESLRLLRSARRRARK